MKTSSSVQQEMYALFLGFFYQHNESLSNERIKFEKNIIKEGKS